MKPSVAIKFLATAIKNREPVLFIGEPGIGKTDIAYSAADLAAAHLLVGHPVVSDPTDFKGIPGIVGDGAKFLPIGDLQRLIDATEPTVYFIDDLGQAPQAVQAAVMQLLLARRIGEHEVSEHVTFIAATNRHQDRAGVTGILEPVKSRFSTIVKLDVDLDDWIQWALQNNMPTDLISFIRFRPNLLHDFKPTHELTNSPCPRTVANVGRWINLGETSIEVIAGAAGEGFAAEFKAFSEVYKYMLARFNPDVILSNPHGTDAPDSKDIALTYALCGALARRVETTTADNLFVYADKLPQEFQALLVKDTLTQKPQLAACRSYIDWASKNHNRNFGG
jgi:hypothetical protein